MEITLSGATGFVGTPLCEALSGEGHQLRILTRSPDRAAPGLPAGARAIRWDGDSSPTEGMDGADAVIHLAGESVTGRWTDEKKQRILDSRVNGTRAIVQAIGQANNPPRTLVSASAVGYYGDRGDQELTEAAEPGDDFLADVAKAWEAEAAAAEALGVRVVRLRIGIVLARGGGALGEMLLPAQLGLGGPLGSGLQWWSWIDREDLISLIRFAVQQDSLTGAVNATAPDPERQRDFAKKLGRVLGRPAFLPAPAFALRLILGGFAAELLSSKLVLPQAAQEAGFRFAHPRLEGSLENALNSV